MERDRTEWPDPDRCNYCGHSRSLHAAGGCRAFVSGNARRSPRPCDCERDALLAEIGSPLRRRHLTIVK